MLLIYFFLHFYLLFFWIFHQKYHNHPQSTVILLGQVIYRSLNCFFLSFIFHNLSSTICKKQNPPRQNHSVSPGRVYHTLIFPCFAGLVHLHATILLSGIFDSSLHRLQQPAQSFCAGCVSLCFLCICLPVRCSMVIS